MARFIRKKRSAPEIPTGTMADISFLLIIFFMVSTTFVVYRGFHVDLPFASQIEPLNSRRNQASLWISPDGNMLLDDQVVSKETLAGAVYQKLSENPRIIIQLKADRKTTYNYVSDAIEELKKAHAVRVSFVAKKE